MSCCCRVALLVSDVDLDERRVDSMYNGSQSCLTSPRPDIIEVGHHWFTLIHRITSIYTTGRQGRDKPDTWVGHMYRT